MVTMGRRCRSGMLGGLSKGVRQRGDAERNARESNTRRQLLTFIRLCVMQQITQPASTFPSESLPSARRRRRRVGGPRFCRQARLLGAHRDTP